MRWAAILGLALLASCTRESRIAVVLEAGGAGLDTVSFELEVLTGPCPSAADYALGRAAGTSVVRQTFIEGMGTSLGPIDPGTYAFVALGRRENCTPALFGCIERGVGDDDTIRIPLADPVWAVGQRCPSDMICAPGGRCTPGVESCAEDTDCGPSSVVQCVAMSCRPRIPAMRSLVETTDNGYSPPLSLTWAPEGDGRVWIHLGTVAGLEGERGAFIESIPLESLDDVASLLVTSPSAEVMADDVVSFDIRFGGETVDWSLGGDENDPFQVIWIGSLDEPGEGTSPSWIGSAVATRAVGPELMVGGQASGGGAESPLYFVTRTLADSGVASMGGLEDGFIDMSEYIPMGGTIPRGAGLRGTGSLGSWLVMEEEPDGDLLLWRPVRGAVPPNEFQRLTRAGTGRPTLAHVDGTAYVLAYPSGASVALTSLTCDATCDLPGASSATLAAEGSVSHASIVEMPDAVFLAAAVETTRGVVIQGVVLDPDLETVDFADGPEIDMLTLDAGDTVHDLRALTVTDAGALHLIAAAIIGPASGADRFVIADATFAP